MSDHFFCLTIIIMFHFFQGSHYDDGDGDDGDEDGDGDEDAWVRGGVHCWRQSPIKAPLNSCPATWSTFAFLTIIVIIIIIVIFLIAIFIIIVLVILTITIIMISI